jgi:predicted transcriptional regulator
MIRDLPADVQDQIARYLASGRYPNEAEILRDALAALAAQDEDMAAIQAGIDDMNAGRTRPFADVAKDILQKYGQSRPNDV